MRNRLLPLAYLDGQNWYDAGGRHSQNPYVYGTNLYRSWSAGYLAAQQDKLERETRRIAA